MTRFLFAALAIGAIALLWLPLYHHLWPQGFYPQPVAVLVTVAFDLAAYWVLRKERRP